MTPMNEESHQGRRTTGVLERRSDNGMLPPDARVLNIRFFDARALVEEIIEKLRNGEKVRVVLFPTVEDAEPEKHDVTLSD